MKYKDMLENIGANLVGSQGYDIGISSQIRDLMLLQEQYKNYIGPIQSSAAPVSVRDLVGSIGGEPYYKIYNDISRYVGEGVVESYNKYSASFEYENVLRQAEGVLEGISKHYHDALSYVGVGLSFQDYIKEYNSYSSTSYPLFNANAWYGEDFYGARFSGSFIPEQVFGAVSELKSLSEKLVEENRYLAAATIDYSDELVFRELENIADVFRQGEGYDVGRYFERVVEIFSLFLSKLSSPFQRERAIAIFMWFFLTFFVNPFATNLFNTIVDGRDIRVLKKIFRVHSDAEQLAVSVADVAIKAGPGRNSYPVAKIAGGTVVVRIFSSKKQVFVETIIDGECVRGWGSKKKFDPIAKKKKRKRNAKR